MDMNFLIIQENKVENLFMLLNECLCCLMNYFKQMKTPKILLTLYLSLVLPKLSF